MCHKEEERFHCIYFFLFSPRSFELSRRSDPAPSSLPCRCSSESHGQRAAHRREADYFSLSEIDDTILNFFPVTVIVELGFLARSVRILLRVVKNTSTCSFLTSRWLSVKRNLILNEGFGFSTRFLDLMNGQDWVMWLQRWFREAQQSFHYLIIPGTGEDRANIMFPTTVVVCSIKMIHHWF